MQPAARALDLEVVDQHNDQHPQRQPHRDREVGRRYDTQVFEAEEVLANPRQQIDWQQVHCIEQEDPDEHCECQRGDQLAALCVVDDALGLGVDQLDENFDCGLEAARHAGRCLARRQPQQPATDHTDHDREECGIKIDDRKIDHTMLVLVLQMLQVVNDVFACCRALRRAFNCHLVAKPCCPNDGRATGARSS